MRLSSVSSFVNIKNSNEKLDLKIFLQDQDHIIDGIFLTPDAHVWYPIIDGVPCFLEDKSNSRVHSFAKKYSLDLPNNFEITKTGQEITNETFSSKWSKFKNYGFDEKHQGFLFDWYQKKLGVESRAALKDFYKDFDKILEVGPGSGFNTTFMANATSGHVYALDISEAAYTTYENTKNLANCTVVQADLMKAPFQESIFDFIIADGVLHHTPCTKSAVFSLYEKLKPGGKFFFYVYKQMGAARFFCDQFIRDSFSKLTTEECYQHCEGITELGRELSQLNAKITLEKPIPILGIPAGEHDVQRLIYYNFMKCFWNENFDFETNNMVNFDWYHPHHAWQHTEDEVKIWLEELGCKKYEFHNANPNGISVLLTKPEV